MRSTWSSDRWESSRVLSPGHLVHRAQDALKSHCSVPSLPRRMLGCIVEVVAGRFVNSSVSAKEVDFCIPGARVLASFT